MASRRITIEVPGLDHGSQPFPIATRVGDLLMTSAIHGRDPNTGQLDPDPRTQIRQVFTNVQTVLSAAGSSTDDVVMAQVLLADTAHRGLVNDAWCTVFPDPADRPTRNTAQRALADGVHCQLLVTAVLA